MLLDFGAGDTRLRAGILGAIFHCAPGAGNYRQLRFRDWDYEAGNKCRFLDSRRCALVARNDRGFGFHGALVGEVISLIDVPLKIMASERNAGSSTPCHFATLSVWSLGMTAGLDFMELAGSFGFFRPSRRTSVAWADAGGVVFAGMFRTAGPYLPVIRRAGPASGPIARLATRGSCRPELRRSAAQA